MNSIFIQAVPPSQLPPFIFHLRRLSGLFWNSDATGIAEKDEMEIDGLVRHRHLMYRDEQNWARDKDFLEKRTWVSYFPS